MPTLTIGDETLAYVRKGRGEPLLLIHSLGTASWLWREQIERWSRHFDVVAFDVRGHGASTHAGRVTTRTIARDLLGAMEALGLTPMHAVGISMGGPILARLYEADPGALKSMVIADSFATQGAAGQERATMLAKKIKDVGMAPYGRDYADETILADTPRLFHAALRDSVAGCDPDAYVEAAQSVFTEDVREIFSGMTLPALVVVGENDNRTPPHLSEQIFGLVPNATYRTIPNAGHLANLDNPEGFHAAVDPFLLQQVS